MKYSVWRKKPSRLRLSCFVCSSLKSMVTWMVRHTSSNHSLASLPLPLPYLFLLAALGAKLDKLRHLVGQLLDYVGVHGTSLVIHLHNAHAAFGTLSLWLSLGSYGFAAHG